MRDKQLHNSQYLKMRDKELMRTYNEAIGKPGLLAVLLIGALEVMCFLADLTAFGALFGQVMGDTMGMVAAGSVSLLFPLMSYLLFQSFASRFSNTVARERLSTVLLVAMFAFFLTSLAIRFPLEAAASSVDGVGWVMGAMVYCLPTVSSILGAFAGALYLHNPQLESKVRAIKLHTRIGDIKAELAALEGNDPSRLKEHVDRIYEAADCQVNGLLQAAVSESLGAMVSNHGFEVHDYLGGLVGSLSEGTGRYDSRPPLFCSAESKALNSPEKPLLQGDSKETDGGRMADEHLETVSAS